MGDLNQARLIPITPEKVQLGKILFYETRISVDGTECKRLREKITSRRGIYVILFRNSRTTDAFPEISFPGGF